MTSHSTYLNTRHFGSLDGLRFLCIAAVLWHHAPGARAYHQLDILLVRGHLGVDFFFVLSGFLITTLLLREDAAKGTISLRGFYWRRSLRILPVYFLVITLAGFNDIVLNGETEKAAILPYYYLFMANFIIPEHIGFLHPTWSLAMEEQYYLIWPLLLLLLPQRAIVPVLLGLIAVNVIAAMGLFSYVGITAVTVGDLRFSIGGATYAPILMGSLVAVILQSRRGFDAIAPLLQHKAAPWLCLAFLIFILSSLPKVLEGLPNLLIHTVMCLILITLVVREDNGLAGLMKLRLIARIGQISYGIYLYHLFARGAVVPVSMATGLDNFWLVLVAYSVLSIIVAELSFRFFESRFLALRHKKAETVS
ncbi:acyltransferase [uncultured Roseobacter sp.]|uniref:acyltransferase family protein n=1 Tax=uncultured Roseobacter sp. TaxID=114847 RepID=UPI002626075B|nr:acyltransferase [uncultured Roseobacter sp.]